MCRVIFAGTRRLNLVPTSYKQLLLEAAERVASLDTPLRSTGAPGVEQHTVEAVLASGGKVELYLPWLGFEQRWVNEQQQRYPDTLDVTVLDPVRHFGWLEATEQLLPATRYVAAGIRKQYACHYGTLVEGGRLVVLPYVRAQRSRAPVARPGVGSWMSRRVTAPEPPPALHRGSVEVVFQLADSVGVPYLDLSEGTDRESLFRWLTEPAPPRRA